jgi:hypothetical protein
MFFKIANFIDSLFYVTTVTTTTTTIVEEELPIVVTPVSHTGGTPPAPKDEIPHCHHAIADRRDRIRTSMIPVFINEHAVSLTSSEESVRVPAQVVRRRPLFTPEGELDTKETASMLNNPIFMSISSDQSNLIFHDTYRLTRNCRPKNPEFSRTRVRDLLRAPGTKIITTADNRRITPSGFDIVGELTPHHIRLVITTKTGRNIIVYHKNTGQLNTKPDLVLFSFCLARVLILNLAGMNEYVDPKFEGEIGLYTAAILSLQLR